ncbi:MAG: hypothetical protein NUW37_02905 [Planctomycetes bacterium]|nr:hypothetical protein [Planctomycetota bacterium]
MPNEKSESTASKRKGNKCCCCCGIVNFLALMLCLGSAYYWEAIEAGFGAKLLEVAGPEIVGETFKGDRGEITLTNITDVTTEDGKFILATFEGQGYYKPPFLPTREFTFSVKAKLDTDVNFFKGYWASVKVSGEINENDVDVKILEGGLFDLTGVKGLTDDIASFISKELLDGALKNGLLIHPTEDEEWTVEFLDAPK